jgi:hypothetical protein
MAADASYYVVMCVGYDLVTEYGKISTSYEYEQKVTAIHGIAENCRVINICLVILFQVHRDICLFGTKVDYRFAVYRLGILKKFSLL